MVFTIKQMQNDIAYYDHGLKQTVRFNAYAFLDEDGHCIIIVAGERRRDSIIEYLSENVNVET